MSTLRIIGGGPAGSAAAIHLARTGHRVRLYEKKRFPRRKLCGGFLSPETRDLLRELDLLEQVDALGAWRVDRVVVTAPSGAIAQAALARPGLSISRSTLDALLLRKARDCGAEVLEGMDGLNAAEAADWILVAAGRRNFREGPRFSRLPGRLFYGMQATFADVPGVTDQVELDLFPGGYVGLARVDRSAVNLCALVDQETLLRAGSGLDDVLRNFMQRNRVLASRLSIARRLNTWEAVGPVVMGLRELSQGTTLYLGDSACVVDPFVGEGIAMALAGARVAAWALNQTDQKASEAYSQAWRRTFKQRLPMGDLLRRATGNRYSQELLVAALQKFPSILEWLTQRTRYADQESTPDPRLLGPTV